ncbi:ArsR/SmtB family transcription factor [Dongshaea marina]|uniref:ArsR/SmtB family transcription factor n=1 Tax=Dongshaea marina TaxID=2047966 RepID=UPI000D3EAB85|nr:metalloregulator ArsR/SmtB family transcription factor [Dongshaea marina]
MELAEMEENAGRAAELLKAMANQQRLMILCMLLDAELSVTELNEKLNLSQSALSQHLALLRRDELVATRKIAQKVYYRVHSDEVRAVLETLYRCFCIPG